MSVYTTIESDELEDFLTNYSVGKLAEHKGISDGIENTNYFVDTQNNNNKRYVLTIFEHHTFEEMQYYLNLMHHLADHQVPSANPVADNEGKYLRVLKDKPAALVERLAGSSIRETTVSHCEQIGTAMGKMHAAGLSFESHQPNPRGPAWCTHTAKTLHVYEDK
jgi:homoserine kinase type II